jgi:hypothetical protein
MESEPFETVLKVQERGDNVPQPVNVVRRYLDNRMYLLIRHYSYKPGKGQTEANRLPNLPPE